MKNNYKLLAMLLLATTMTFAQQTVLFDFGGVFNTALTMGANYNNMTEDLYQTQAGDHAIADMINDTGANTGFSFAITSSFQYFNEAGTQAVTNDAAFFHLDATKDSMFTQAGGESVGEVTFSNLDDTKYYSFEIFSNRKTTQNREGQFTITGANSEVGYLNAGGSTTEGNTANTLVINNIQSNSGSISISVENGPNNVSNWSYLNCLKMVETDNVVSTEQDILANGGLELYPNPADDVLNINYILDSSTNSSVLIYDVMGRLVFDATNSLNQEGTYSYKWNRLDNNGKRVTAGAYFLTLKTENSSVTKKLILK